MSTTILPALFESLALVVVELPKPVNTCVGFEPDIDDPVADPEVAVVLVVLALIRVGFWAPQGLSVLHAS